MTPKIEAIIDRALTDLREALLDEARTAMAGILNFSSGPAKPKKGTAPKGTPKGTVRLADGRLRRSPEELEALKGRIVAYVKKHPGSRAENISRELGVPSAGLAGPIAQLLTSRALTKKGQRRATSYTAR